MGPLSLIVSLLFLAPWVSGQSLENLQQTLQQAEQTLQQNLPANLQQAEQTFQRNLPANLQQVEQNLPASLQQVEQNLPASLQQAERNLPTILQQAEQDLPANLQQAEQNFPANLQQAEQNLERLQQNLQQNLPTNLQNVSYAELISDGRELVSNTLNSIRRTLNSTAPCSCVNQNLCTCCVQLNISQVSVSPRVCFVINYGSDNTITFSTEVNNRNIYQRILTDFNPPPFCLPIPQIPGITICTQLTNVVLSPTLVQVCLNLRVRESLFTLVNYDFDCLAYTQNRGLQIFRPIPTTTTRRSVFFF